MNTKQKNIISKVAMELNLPLSDVEAYLNTENWAKAKDRDMKFNFTTY